MAVSNRTLDIPTPRAYLPLLPRRQFKGAKGGRGGAKSRFYADKLIESCVSEHTRAACVREVQNSIKDSVKQLLEDSIGRFKVGHKFKITEREIVGPRDSLIVFRGLQNHTATSIKSLEGFNRAWYEEAQSLSQKSLDLATNTFRTEDSEQWFSWNPDLAKDPVDTFFRENKDDPDFVCVEVNYYDNPWFPDVLRKNMERDRQRDPEKYGHIWLGGYRKNSAAQVFTNYKVERFDPPPPGTQLYFGADWGMTIDPTVLVVCFIVGRKLYVWREVWELGCGIDKRGALFDKIDPDWSIVKVKDPNWKSIARKFQITGDSSEPQTIKYLKENGFPRLQPAVKGPGSVEEGVSFLQSYDIVVHPDCKSPDGISHVADELALYSYKVDKKTLAVLPELEDKKNHMIDSLRYALENVRRATQSGSQEMNF
jgi:phage terminase large subunit